MLMKDLLNIIGSALLTHAVFLWGGWDIAMQCLITVIIIDYITGVIKACYLKQLSSRIGFKGILKKILILAMVSVGVMVDRVSGMNGMVRTPVIYFFVMNDAISVVENAAACGIKAPKFLIKLFNALKDESNDGNKRK